MLSFNGAPLLGLHGNIEEGPVELRTIRAHYFGPHGGSELVGGRGGRKLRVYAVLVNAPATIGQINQYLQQIAQVVGSHGELVQTEYFTGTLQRRYANCTFEGFEPEKIGQHAGPYIDPDYGAWQPGYFHFYQVSIENDLDGLTGPGKPGGGSGG